MTFFAAVQESSQEIHRKRPRVLSPIQKIHFAAPLALSMNIGNYIPGISVQQRATQDRRPAQEAFAEISGNVGV
jgi:hypothetical protein